METATSNLTAQRELFITMALTAWNTHNERVTKLFDTLTDEQILSETAPGRNRGIYLFGHLVAVNDRLFSLFGLGDRFYPQLDEPFLSNPDKAKEPYPTVAELKESWKKVNDGLQVAFKKLTADEWFEKHNSVTAEDFAKDPQRNKLNVLLNRTSHTGYHLGQLVYLKAK
jgi:hypothetical protein